jgi:hypothetical protein
MQDLIGNFDLINCKTTYDNHGGMVDHINLDNNTFNILFL